MQVDPLEILRERESYRDWYLAERDPISRDRLRWQAQSFRHLVHLVPGETILEVAAGRGCFTRALAEMAKARNPIAAVVFNQDAVVLEEVSNCIEVIRAQSFPGALAHRKFTYVVMENILDRRTATFLLPRLFDLLEEGGQMVLFESNPWNMVFAVRNFILRRLRRPRKQRLVSRAELYELLSEIGFMRISARFTDFVYPPLSGGAVWILRNLSIVLENTPGVRSLAGRILIHAQKPPRESRRPNVSLYRHDSLKRAVSVVIPCHNEEANLGPLILGLRKYYDDYIQQFVLVDDNSTDGTRAEIARLASADSRVTPVFRSKPNGVGRALREGFAQATGRYILSMDCDFQHLLPDIEDMFDAAAEGSDAVFGSRFSRHSVLINYPFGKIVANRIFHLVIHLVLGCKRRDVTNNLKLLRTDIARRIVIREPDFAANAEIGLQLAMMGEHVCEVPISWIDRTFDMGQSNFRVLRSGGGYMRVLARMAMVKWFGRSLVKGLEYPGPSGTDRKPSLPDDVH